MSEHRALLVESPARLTVDHGRLKIATEDKGDSFVLPGDIAVLVLHHPAIQVTGQVLRALTEAGASVLITDQQHMPCGQLWPWGGQAVHGRRLRAQIQLIGTQRQKELWAEIVRAKVRTQAATLRLFAKAGGLRLERIAGKVSRTNANHSEAEAARHYWKQLSGDNFKRERQGATDAVNCRLNYGYAVLRSLVGRELSAVGLHPALGIGHVQVENTFNLADDFVEPFRFLVDRRLFAVDLEAPFDGHARMQIAAFVEGKLQMAGEEFRVPSAVAECVASFCRAIENDQGELILPD
jgi:CRISPR-associated protein Cas1